MAEKFDAYRKWLGIKPEEQPPNHYRLLGIDLFESDPDVIANAADRQMAHVRTFQTGQHAKDSQHILNELAAARICLLAPQKKAEYDFELRRQLETRMPPVAPTAALTLDGSDSVFDSIVGSDLEAPGVHPRPSRLNPLVVQLLAAGAIAAALLVGIVLVLGGFKSADEHAKEQPDPSEHAEPSGQLPGVSLAPVPPLPSSPKTVRPKPPEMEPTLPASASGVREIPKPVPSVAPPLVGVIEPSAMPGRLTLDGPPASAPPVPSSDEPIQGTPTLAREISTESEAVRAITLSSSGKYILSAAGKKAQFWDADDGRQIRSLPDRRAPILDLRTTPDAPNIALSLAAADGGGGAIELWPFSGRSSPARQIDLTDAKFARQIRFTPGGKYLVAGCEDGSVRFFAVADGREVARMKEQTGSIRCVAVSPDGRRVLSGSEDGMLRMWNAATGELLLELQKSQEGPITAVAFARQAEDPRIFYSNRFGVIQILEGDKPVHGYTPSGGVVNAFELSPAGQYSFLGTANGTVAIWSLRPGEAQIWIHKGHDDETLALAYSPERRELISGSKDGKIRIWTLNRQDPSVVAAKPNADPGMSAGAGDNGQPTSKTPGADDVAGKMPDSAEPPEDPSKETGAPAVQGLACRKDPAKSALLKTYGGTAESEAAVTRAVEWLVGHQYPDGSWNFNHNTPRCGGQCTGAVTRNTAPNGATAIALLALLGANQTPRQGEYRKNAAAAVQFLKMKIRVAAPNAGSLGDQYSYGIHSHALGTMALCESYGVVRDKTGRLAALGCINFICATQQSDGGWPQALGPTLPRSPTEGELESTAWCLAALKTAQHVGLPVPDATLKGANQFLDQVQRKDRGQSEVNFASRIVENYSSPNHVFSGLYSRMCLGWGRDRPEYQQAVDGLEQYQSRLWGPEFRYFKTYVLRDVGGPVWSKWNAEFRDQLVAQQEKAGHATGSWLFTSTHQSTQTGGRLYCTAINALMLESYYRYPPPL